MANYSMLSKHRNSNQFFLQQSCHLLMNIKNLNFQDISHTGFKKKDTGNKGISVLNLHDMSR